MKKVLIALLSTLTLSALADANNIYQPYNGSGAYINANSGFATMQNVSNTSPDLSANAGYNFNRAFALEGGLTYLPSLQGGQLATYTIYDVAARGTIPLSNVFSLYGRLGLATAYSSWSGSMCTPAIYQNTGNAWNYGGLAGVGTSFALSKHFDLRLEDYAYNM